MSSDILTKYEKWYRLKVLLHEGGNAVFKDILTKLGVKNITDGSEIYQKLKPYEIQGQKLQQYQKDALFPSSRVINTNNLDLSLQFLIIIILDTQKEYPLIDKLRDMRNTLFHMPENKKDMTAQQFSDYWRQISKHLTGLGCDMTLFSDLKTCNLSSEELKKIFKELEGRV